VSWPPRTVGRLLRRPGDGVLDVVDRENDGRCTPCRWRVSGYAADRLRATRNFVSSACLWSGSANGDLDLHVVEARPCGRPRAAGRQPAIQLHTSSRRKRDRASTGHQKMMPMLHIKLSAHWTRA